MRDHPDFDHTSFAVPDAMVRARQLRRHLGATPIAGEVVPEFRYLLLHVGTAHQGARIELIDPTADGFLTRYLDRRGEGPHHLTFTVPDLRASVDRVRALGLHVSGENYTHPSWQEAFIAPDAVHGVVIQLAQCEAAYPPPAELLATKDRDVDSFPSSVGATDRTWWTPVWDVDPQAEAVAGATHLGTSNLETSRRLFEDVLHAATKEIDGGLAFRWPSGSLHTIAGPTPGVHAIDVTGGPVEGVVIGPVTLGGRRSKPDKREDRCPDPRIRQGLS